MPPGTPAGPPTPPPAKPPGTAPGTTPPPAVGPLPPAIGVPPSPPPVSGEPLSDPPVAPGCPGTTPPLAPLFPAATRATPIVSTDGSGVITTRGAGRVRGRHELEAQFSLYLPLYFENRSYEFTIEDTVAAGGDRP